MAPPPSGIASSAAHESQRQSKFQTNVAIALISSDVASVFNSLTIDDSLLDPSTSMDVAAPSTPSFAIIWDELVSPLPAVVCC